MADCDADPDTRSAVIDLSVQFTELKLSPPVVASFLGELTMATMSLTNGGADTVNVGSVSLGGRHPTAFSIDADGCSGRILAAGRTCKVTVSYVVDGVEGNPYHHAVMKFPNDDPLAPELSVALFGDSYW